MAKSSFVFNAKPKISIRRNVFDLSYSQKTTFNVGELCPVYIQEVYPGDTLKVKSANVVRTTVPFIRPVMDNLYMDVAYFFVPNRLVYDDWSAVMGENKSSAWALPQEKFVPVVSGTVASNTIADNLGIPPGQYDINANASISRLPFRAYALIWNEWYRDENLQDPVLINTSYTDTGVFNNNVWSPTNIYGKLAPVNKLHDRFTSALPQPQKGTAVPVVLGTTAPVITTEFANFNNVPQYPLLFGKNGTGDDVTTDADNYLRFQINTGSQVGRGNELRFGTLDPNTIDIAPTVKPVPLNLVADLGASLDSLNVNDLRFAFQLQKMFEKDARGGTRYTEYLQEHFGVRSPDARLQRPEYLGGTRAPLSITQVTNQTSSSNDELALGVQSGYSLSNGMSGFSKSFVEHGFVIGLAYVRYKHTYQQGIEKFWNRTQRIDYYDPVFANIGEQPIYTSELYSSAPKGNVFGYNEAWSDLRRRPNQVSGGLRSIASNGLDVWHFADLYTSTPYLGNEWIKEDVNFVDRTLSADSSSIANFIVDFYHDVKAVRPMPLYSTPGLIDHH